MKMSYKYKIFFFFLIIFLVFTTSIVIIKENEERTLKKEALESRLNSYTGILDTYLKQGNPGDSISLQLDRLAKSMPDSIRISIINKEGKVIYDNDVTKINAMDNHLDRPEIASASFQDHGTNVRFSTSTQIKYLYYAKQYSHYYIRVALPFTIVTKSMLQADNLFIYAIGILFLLVMFLINFAAGRFGKSISQLKRFTRRVRNNEDIPDGMQFSNDELGDIGNELREIIKQKEDSKRSIENEREKLIRHFQFSGEGLCIFNADRKKIYANTHFMQHINFILDRPILNVERILSEEEFKPVNDFINDTNRDQQHMSFSVSKNGKVFYVQSIVFGDNTFEVTIKDISKIEKNRQLKQEMTNNIAHELKTPVTSLRGFLETMTELDLEPEKQKLFIERAYQQSIRLSALVEDIGMVNKLDEATSSFTIEKVHLSQIVNEARIDLSDRIIANNTTLHINIKDNLVIDGNQSLLYSIFRNLIDNSINYAGKDTNIYVSTYMDDNDFVYMSYYDTGAGVAEQHLSRLFERFYRVDEGRTRNTGGSGLGLSIVKHAVLFHKGNIQAKNRPEGGLEFLFTLKKDLPSNL